MSKKDTEEARSRAGSEHRLHWGPPLEEAQVSDDGARKEGKKQGGEKAQAVGRMEEGLARPVHRRTLFSLWAWA